MRNVREYLVPQSVEEALRLLSREGVKSALLAGGTRLSAASPHEVESVIDLKALPLAYIQPDASGLRIGALTRLQAIVDSPAVAQFAGGALAEASRFTCSHLLRNQGTLAGTLLSEDLNAELASVLLVLDAEVLIRRMEGQTTLSLGGLYENFTAGIEGAVLCEIFVPDPGPEAKIHRRRIARTASDRAIVTVTALVRDAGIINELRVSAAGIGLKPMRLPGLELELTGRKLDDIAGSVGSAVGRITFTPTPATTADYSRAALEILIQRAVRGA